MEEKTIVKSEQYNVKKFFKIMLIIGAVLSVLSAFTTIGNSIDDYNYCAERYAEHQADGNCGYYYEDWEKCYACKSYEEGVLGIWFEIGFVATLAPFAVFALVGGLIYCWLNSYEMVVTDKRVFGRVGWGKRVDLPLDSVSSTATVTVLHGVAVATSSGRIKFLLVKNSAEIFEKVNALLVERQKSKNEATPVQSASPAASSADELKKFKELLDSGVITQEEFDAKKKELLGL